MQNGVIRMARRLSPKPRAAIAEEFGRTLADDDEISISRTRRATRQTKQQGMLPLLERGRSSLASMSTATPEEIEAAIMEALCHVRPGYHE